MAERQVLMEEMVNEPTSRIQSQIVQRALEQLVNSPFPHGVGEVGKVVPPESNREQIGNVSEELQRNALAKRLQRSGDGSSSAFGFAAHLRGICCRETQQHSQTPSKMVCVVFRIPTFTK